MNRIFPEFNTDSNCPICGTNDNTPCVLIPIMGTEDGNNIQAKAVHVNCLLDNLLIFNLEDSIPIVSASLNYYE